MSRIVFLSLVIVLVVGVLWGAAAEPSRAAVIDDFGDGTIDSLLWLPSTRGTGPTLTEQNGRIEMFFPANSDDPQDVQITATLRSRCALGGDFDVQADWAILAPPSNELPAGINIRLDLSNTIIQRQSLAPSTEQYSNVSESVTVATTHMSGTFRMVRTGSNVDMFYHDGTNFVLLETVNAGTSNKTVFLQAFSSEVGGQFQGKDTLVTWDNFEVDAGTFVCATPTPTVTPTATPTFTGTPATSTPTATSTFTGTPATATPTATSTPTATATATSTETGTPTSTATSTETGTPTSTATSTATSTSTATGTPPTATSTTTTTSTSTQTATRTFTPTRTPTVTPGASQTATATATSSFGTSQGAGGGVSQAGALAAIIAAIGGDNSQSAASVQGAAGTAAPAAISPPRTGDAGVASPDGANGVAHQAALALLAGLSIVTTAAIWRRRPR